VSGVGDEIRCRSRTSWLILSALVTVLSVAKETRGDEVSSRALASQQFRRGVELAKNAELAEAVAAFEKAYETHPHHAVLYNLGQAYLGLGRSVEAVHTFEAFLKEGAGAIDARRREEVEAVVKRERAHIGSVTVSLHPSDAEVLVDDRRFVGSRDTETFELARGHHTIAARKQGYLPRIESVQIEGGETVRVSLELVASEPVLAMGQLVVACEVPAVEVVVDGERRGTTPLSAPLLLPAGTRSLRLSRTGYEPFERRVAVVSGGASRVACDITPDLRATKPGRLKVSVSEPYARVSVDGAPFDDGPLPFGPHVVRVDRAGFVRWEQLVSIEPGRTRTIAALLEPTPEHRSEVEARSRRQDYWAIGLGATGVALLGTAAGLFVWNDGRYDAWKAEPGSPARAAELQRTDDIAAGLAILGAGAAAAAGVLWFTSDRPHATERATHPSRGRKPSASSQRGGP
jgi:hypothetical protein